MLDKDMFLAKLRWDLFEEHLRGSPSLHSDYTEVKDLIAQDMFTQGETIDPSTLKKLKNIYSQAFHWALAKEI